MWSKVIACLVLLSAVILSTQATKCLNPKDGKEVDWWFFIKRPRDQHLLYADSKTGLKVSQI